jgi:magnesium-transporting ATPase (P-type)
VTLGLTLAFEPAEPGIMARPPRPRDAPILSPFLAWRIVFVAFLLLACTYGLFAWERDLGTDLASARSVAVNMLVAGEIVYLVNCRRIMAASWRWDGLFGSRPVLIGIGLVVLLQMPFTYLPAMQELFGTGPVGPASWGRIALLAVGLFIVVELEKAAGRSIRGRKAAATTI